MSILMGSYEHSYGFLRKYNGFLWKFLWVPMNIPMGSYKHSYLWVPMNIPMGSYEHSYGFL